MNHNYYDILGVAKDSSLFEIKAKYRELSLRFHPDKIQSSLAQEMMKKINEAYSVLSDPQQRKQYDQNYDISEEIHSQSNTKKSTRSVWAMQLKEMGKGLGRLWQQYLEYQRKNQKNQKQKDSRYDYDDEHKYKNRVCNNPHCTVHHNHDDCDCCEPKSPRKPATETNHLEDEWIKSQKRDAEFLDNMFGFGKSSKKKKDSWEF